jgi:hypothetical protein
MGLGVSGPLLYLTTPSGAAGPIWNKPEVNEIFDKWITLLFKWLGVVSQLETKGW